MAPSELPILYDLVFRKDSRSVFYSPHTIKARAALAHKNVDFTTVEVTYNDTRDELSKKLGVAKATAPILQLPSGELIMDSMKIAEYLEKTYPNEPSLFIPGAKLPVDPDTPHAKMAKAFIALWANGMGDSDSQWSPVWELACVPLGEKFDTAGGLRDYYKSDSKQGAGEYNRIAALDQNELKSRISASLIPVEATLKVTPYLAGDDVSFVDWILYGRYVMLAAADQKLADELFKSHARVSEWIARVEKRYEHSEQWRDHLDRMRGAAAK